jgi:hypothetical protein
LVSISLISALIFVISLLLFVLGFPCSSSFKIDEGKFFHDKQKLKQYMAMKPPLQKILKGILCTEDENKCNYKRTESIKPQEKNRQVLRE